MTAPKAKRSTRRQHPAPAARRLTPAQRQAILQAVLFDNALAEISAMRDRLQSGDCPATVTEGERRAAVVDLERALGQMGNLRRHYGRGGR